MPATTFDVDGSMAQPRRASRSNPHVERGLVGVRCEDRAGVCSVSFVIESSFFLLGPCRQARPCRPLDSPVVHIRIRTTYTHGQGASFGLAAAVWRGHGEWPNHGQLPWGSAMRAPPVAVRPPSPPPRRPRQGRARAEGRMAAPLAPTCRWSVVSARNGSRIRSRGWRPPRRG